MNKGNHENNETDDLGRLLTLLYLNACIDDINDNVTVLHDYDE